ncbi:hypothetical protein BBP00_00008956 [Phytophthora kernoviae]|uniref:EF-hand domain-containing protein n=1 Tax=Phytophthora kernoviae TaxID=325452 RepID=A0A3F2RE05_9STRA|nr:hypothetical protein BBP00_00008956 [Phytophthora kernoviae]
MKRAPLLDYAIVEAVYSAMAGQAQRRAIRHRLEQFAKYEAASQSGAIKVERFIKCLVKMGVHLDNKKDYEALAACFRCSGSSRGDGDNSDEAEKSTQLVDYVSFVDFACNVHDSEKLSEIAESLRGSISKHQRGWITSTQFERALEREDQGPSFRLSAAQVSALVDRFEYEFEKQQLGIDYMQFAQWLQPLLHLDVKNVHERIKSLIEEAWEKHGWKLDEVFKAMDDDRNGEIDAIELKEALLEMGLPLTNAQIRCLADEYDVDGDGKIQYKEFLSLFPPPGKKRANSKKNVLGRDRTRSNSETGSTTDAIKKRKNRPKRNVRNSFSWGITKAFARKQPTKSGSDNNGSSSGLDVEQLRQLQRKRVKKIKHRADFDENSDEDVEEEGSADELENSEDGEGGEEWSRSDDEYHKHLKRSLRRAFDFFDLDQTSTIDKRELSHVLRALGHEFTSKEVESEMASADLDRNSQLDFYEFVAFVKRQLSQKTYLLSQQREMEIRQSFQTLDTDKNGALDEQEFEYLIYKVLQVELSVEEQDALLDFIDKDADGLISEDEFVTFMKKLEILHRKHIGKGSWKKQKRFLDSLDATSQLAYSAMKKLVRVRQLLAKRSDIMRRKEKLWGGTANGPIDIEHDELLRRRTGWRAWTNMFTKPSLPLMGIKSVPIDSLAEDLQQFVRKMPPVVIAPFVSLPILAEYMVLVRKTLACVASSSSVMTCEPALKLLPRIVDDHMALSIFRKLFDAEVATLKPGEERQLKFQELVLRMWPSFVQWQERLPPSLVMRVIRRIRRLAGAWIVYRWHTAEEQMDFLREPVDGIALSEGFPVNGFRLMVALAGCSLVAPLIHLARTETSRHLFNIVAGLFAGAFVFGTAVLHTIGTAVAVYLVMMMAPRKIVGRLVLTLLLAYLVGIHYYREFHSPDIVWDSAQMILTLKLSSVAINYCDGGLPKEKKTPTMLKNELQDIPALIPYFGFIFFFPTYLAGPAFEYKDYIYWMKDIRFAPFLVHIRNLFVLVVSAAGFFASLQFPVEEIDSPDFYPDSPWAFECLLSYRSRVWQYLAWSLAEAASAAAGVGYVQATGKWNGITNNDLLCVELPTNFRVAINNWNMGVARWINTYIYQRVGLSKSGKSGLVSTMASFFVSALWHVSIEDVNTLEADVEGLSPGYYLFFLLGGIYIEVGKHLRRRLRSYFHYTEDRKAHSHAIFFSYFGGTSHPMAFFYDIVGMSLTWVAMQYAGVAFEIMDVRRCIAIWRSWYFLPHIISIGLLVFFNLFPLRRSTATATKKTQ